jgi:maleate isomerase
MDRRRFLSISATAATGLPVASMRDHAQSDSWQPDGAGTIARFGVLTPDFDANPESELWAMAPRGVSLHTSRVRRTGGQGASLVEAPNIDEAIDRLAEVRPKAILLGYTSSSYALGAEADRRVQARLEERAKGTRVIFPAIAALVAFRQLGAQRIALIHPPWWTETAHRQGCAYWRAAGFDVRDCFRMQGSPVLAEVAPREVFDAVVAHTPNDAQAVFIGGNGMRAVGAIAALEKQLGRPVLTANQIILWQALVMIGQTRAVTRYGRIFLT